VDDASWKLLKVLWKETYGILFIGAYRSTNSHFNETNFSDLEKGEEISEKNEQLSTLYKCIAQLEENERIIITMVLDELPYAEIAEISGISEGNLRVKIHRIKQKLTELYNRHERF
jgi:RNA polymerase sigma factor (sigma-70 family)